MARVPFTKLKCKIDDSIKQVKINEEITIEVKQYLPIQEKLGLIGRVVELAHEQDANYSNPVKADVFTKLEIIFTYSNITFTDKQKEDTPKLYDMLASSGIIDTIINNIPTDEYMTIVGGVEDTIESVYKYQNSVLGILDTLKDNYGMLEGELGKITETLENSEGIDFVKNLIEKVN